MATDGGSRRLWSRQPGTSGVDGALGVATDADGSVYVVGSTGMIDDDAWVIKFDGHGRRLWSRQLPGTSGNDYATSVATDTDGNVSVAGVTFGALGGPNKGDADAWVIKYAR
jgi:hypothetical protein